MAFKFSVEQFVDHMKLLGERDPLGAALVECGELLELCKAALMLRRVAAELLACHDDMHHLPAMDLVLEAELLLKKLGLPFRKELSK